MSKADDVLSKFTSRKFWVCVAAFLASLGTGISGIATGNQNLAIAGSICCVLSGAIYAACEAYVDGASVKSTVNTVTVTASSSDKNIVASAVKSALVPDSKSADIQPSKAESE